MNLFEHSSHKAKKEKRVARGGKRGTTSGRGTKGQKSRTGHRIRPAERDLLIRIPKLRGYKNKPITEKVVALNVGDLEKMSENVLTKKNLGNVKILGGGELKKKITVEGLAVSKSAKSKIEKVGGTVK
jgi:large subunit ribosomal protein L15